MRKGRNGLGLALETGERAGIGCDGLGEDLDRDVPIQLPVPRLVDLTHPTRAKRRQDLVGTDVCTG